MKPINRERVDTAWDKLYTRLESEDLIEQNKHKSKFLYFTPTVKWVASIAILVLCLAAYSYFSSKKNNNIHILQCTEESSTLMASLEDGSIIGLGKHSSIEYSDFFAKDKREVSLKGNAYFDIAKDRKTFLIETDRATVEVLGTAFCIESDANQFFISVQRGKVKVNPKDGSAAIYLNKNENLLLAANKSVKSQNDNTENFPDYFKQIHFKDQRLNNIVRIVNLHQDSIMIKVDPKVANRSLTVRFTNQDKEQIANLIALALDLKTNKENNIITITERNSTSQ